MVVPFPVQLVSTHDSGRDHSTHYPCFLHVLRALDLTFKSNGCTSSDLLATHVPTHGGSAPAVYNVHSSQLPCCFP
jgi:hypothetical protein